ncbi:hypothetical protein SpAn4DRAFT_1482 [Sporomusa ovata]|uniref:Uncharacterized protein n=1 Tax=Sporomusa ovata TaxID=2378 RepID=A0A0U1KUG2_9FIRM|nr:hypothetical protein SpAn4DRAFT_1482 [Sporomusa ovata]
MRKGLKFHSWAARDFILPGQSKILRVDNFVAQLAAGSC